MRVTPLVKRRNVSKVPISIADQIPEGSLVCLSRLSAAYELDENNKPTLIQVTHLP